MEIDEDPKKKSHGSQKLLSRVLSSNSLECGYVRTPTRGYIFVLLLLGDEVLAILEAFDLEFVALGPRVNVFDVVCRGC